MTRTTIHSDYIPDNAITGVKIAENSITAREIATNAITTLYVADDSVTADKLANSINTDIATGVTANTTANAALPKAGGTMTGALTTNGVINTGTSHNFAINTPNALRINIDSNDSGTSEVFVVGHNQTGVDASNNVLLCIRENGKVSIGHGSSNANFHVGSAAATGTSANPAIQVGGSSTYRLGLYTDSEGGIIQNLNGDDGIQFRVKTAGEAMRIDGGTGRVGIGTSSPAQTLHVVGGQARFDDHISIQPTKKLYLDGGNDTYIDEETANTISINTGGGERMRLNTTGVGIGTTGPVTKLHVRGTASDTITAANSFAAFDGTGGDGIIIGARSSSPFEAYIQSGYTPNIGTSHHYPLLLNPHGGNVGIGGTNPSAKCHLYTSTSDAINLGIQNSQRYWKIETVSEKLSIADVSAGGLARMTFDTSGNVGIGTSSPATKVHVKASGDCELRLEAGTNSDARVRFGDATDNDLGYIGFNRNSGYMNFSTVNTSGEAMRINANGSVMIGTTTNPTYPHKIYATGAAIPDGIASFRDTDNTVALSNGILSLMFSGDNDATSGYFVYMTDGNGAIGSIQAASGTSVSFNTTSDERLKKNIVDASPQLDMIKGIKVREFDWKRNDHHELGLIAQEIKDTIPNVVGEGGDDETKNPYGVDYGKLTPYIIKAMQEQQTLIEALTARIETLEG